MQRRCIVRASTPCTGLLRQRCRGSGVGSIALPIRNRHSPCSAMSVQCCSVATMGTPPNDGLGGDDAFDDLVDFENVLLGGEANSSCDSGSNNNLSLTDVANLTHHAFSAHDCAQTLLDTLPADGASVALTSLTGDVDLEAVADYCGSMLALLEQYPHWFRLEQMVGKWYVGRKHRIGTAASVSGTTHPHGNVAAEQGAEKQHQQRPPRRQQQRVKLQRLDASAMLAQISESVILHMLELVPAASSVPLTDLRETLLSDTKEDGRDVAGTTATLRRFEDAGFSLRFILKHHPVFRQQLMWPVRNEVTRTEGGALSEDDIRRIVAASADSGGGSGGVRYSSASLEKDAEYAADEWLVELDLDAVESGKDAVPKEADDDAAAEEVPLPHAPVAPISSAVRRIVPPPPMRLSSCAPTDSMPRVSLPSSKLIQLLLECVPTFPIRLSSLRVSDTLNRALITVPVVHLLRCFPRVFVVDTLVGVVQVKPSFVHRDVGNADFRYSADDRCDAAASVQREPCHREAVLAMPFKSQVEVDDATLKHLQVLIDCTSSRRLPIALGGPLARKGVDGGVKGGSAFFSKSTVALGGGASSVTKVEEVVQKNAFPMWSMDEKTVSALPLWQVPSHRYEPVSAFPPEVQHFLRHYHATLDKHHALVRVSDGVTQTGLVRLRPWWLSPSALAEWDSPTSSGLQQPQMEWIMKQLRPLWSPIARLLKNADPTLVDSLRAVGTQVLNDTSEENARVACEAWKQVADHREVVVALAHFGKNVWVSPCGTRVRRYCADPNLDDHQHIAVELLHASLPPISSDPASYMVDFGDHLQKLPFSQTLVAPCDGGHEPKSLEELSTFLCRHHQRFTLDRDVASNRWRLGRYSPFRHHPHGGGSSLSPNDAQAAPRHATPLTALFANGKSGSWASISKSPTK